MTKIVCDLCHGEKEVEKCEKGEFCQKCKPFREEFLSRVKTLVDEKAAEMLKGIERTRIEYLKAIARERTTTPA